MESVLKLGAHVELLKKGIKLDSPESIEQKYISSIREVIDSNTFLIDNPTFKARLIPMHAGERYDIYVFIGKKIYQGTISIVGNAVEGKMRVVKVTLTSSLIKYERRQFFRLETTMDVRYLLITPENSAAFKIAVKSGGLLSMEGFENGTTIDIIGGGLRFTSKRQLPVGGMAIMHLIADMEAGKKNYIFLAKVLVSDKHNTQRDLYDHRVQFVDLKQDAREELVQFIFQCERERLKKRR